MERYLILFQIPITQPHLLNQKYVHTVVQAYQVKSSLNSRRHVVFVISPDFTQ